MKPTDFLTPCDKVPRGFKTSLQWSKQWDLSTSRTIAILIAAVRAGQVERRMLRARAGSSLRRVPFYGKK